MPDCPTEKPCSDRNRSSSSPNRLASSCASYKASLCCAISRFRSSCAAASRSSLAASVITSWSRRAASCRVAGACMPAAASDRLTSSAATRAAGLSLRLMKRTQIASHRSTAPDAAAGSHGEESAFMPGSARAAPSAANAIATPHAQPGRPGPEPATSIQRDRSERQRLNASRRSPRSGARPTGCGPPDSASAPAAPETWSRGARLALSSPSAASRLPMPVMRPLTSTRRRTSLSTSSTTAGSTAVPGVPGVPPMRLHASALAVRAERAAASSWRSSCSSLQRSSARWAMRFASLAVKPAGNATSAERA